MATHASVARRVLTSVGFAFAATLVLPAVPADAMPKGSCNVRVAGKARIAIRFACSKLGTPYRWGGTGPNYDCSGLTQAAWRAAAISIPRTTYEQWSAGSHISYSRLRPGDLVFFEPSHGHVGIYLGGGRMIHSPHTGDVVKISDMSSGYYRSHFQGGVHVR